MAWKTISEKTEKVLDRNSNIYVQRAERALCQGRVEEALKEIDIAIEYSEADKKVHYYFEKVKMLYAGKKNYECSNFIEQNLKNFYNCFKVEKFKEVLRILNNTDNCPESKMKTLLNERGIPWILAENYVYSDSSYSYFELEAERCMKGKDYERCIQYYELAKKASDGIGYEEFIENCKTVLSTINDAKNGDAHAQYKLGYLYRFGFIGVEVDEEEALKWYRMAAEKGDTDACIFVGKIYEAGEGVLQNKEEATKWYRKAAEQGNADAQYYLGRMYENGEGVSENKQEAVRLYRKAAEQGNTKAQRSLGLMYSIGYGVVQNKQEAIKWYRKAAEHGDVVAQTNLGYFYDIGDLVEKNKQEAIRWYRKAAEQGYASAQYYLGEMYADGDGIAKNKQEAIKWLRKAAEQGDKSAIYKLKELKL